MTLCGPRTAASTRGACICCSRLLSNINLRYLTIFFLHDHVYKFAFAMYFELRGHEDCIFSHMTICLHFSMIYQDSTFIVNQMESIKFPVSESISVRLSNTTSSIQNGSESDSSNIVNHLNMSLIQATQCCHKSNSKVLNLLSVSVHFPKHFEKLHPFVICGGCCHGGGRLSRILVHVHG
jgi:hypothetical protein